MASADALRDLMAPKIKAVAPVGILASSIGIKNQAAEIASASQGRLQGIN